MKKNFKLLMLTLIMSGGFFASEAMALEQDSNGVYQIGSADDLINFSSGINNGTISNDANAVLTADIDFGENADFFTPIGVEAHRYGGTFDGKGHRIKNMKLNGGVKEQGLFHLCHGGTIIRNLVIDVSCSYSGTGKNCQAALIGCTNSSDTDSEKNTITIEWVGNEMNFSVSEENNGGFVGRDYSPEYGSSVNNQRITLNIIIKNCYNKGNISGGRDNGAFTGWTPNVTLINCWNTGKIENTENYNSSNSLARGNQPSLENCFDLNSENNNRPNNNNPEGYSAEWISNGYLCRTIWGDNNHFCNSWGFCVLCNAFASNFMSAQSDGYYHITSKQQLNWFSHLVKNVNNAANAKLDNNINMNDITDFKGIGCADHEYCGTFDGQGYTIDYLSIVDNEKVGNLGLFGKAKDRAVIKNFILGPNSSIAGRSWSAAILGVAVGTGTITIENVGNEANVYTFNIDDMDGEGKNIAAFVGVCNLGETTINITNCYNTGNVKGRYDSAIICGWFGSNSTVTNFFNSGTVEGVESSDNTQKTLYRNSATLTRVYNTLDGQGNKIQDGALENGKICYLLNNSSSENPVWGQTIGTDNHPLLFSTDHGVVSLAGNIYNNSGKTDDYFGVTNKDDMEALATYVNAGNNNNVTIKLENDIDMSGSSFLGIGTADKKFSGEIDGQGHRILNWVVNKVNENAIERVGLIRYALGITLKNMTMDKTCSFTVGNYSAPFVADMNHSTTQSSFINLGNEASVTGGTNAGGIIGCNFGGFGDNMTEKDTWNKVTMINCYNTGSISGKESGALAGWFGDAPIIFNCYSTGTVSGDGSNGFGRGNTTNANITGYKCINCFTTSKSGMDGVTTSVQSANFENGTVFASLFDYTNPDNNVDGSVWRMDFAATTPHPVLNGNAIAMREDCTNRMVAGEYDVTVYRTTKAGVWNTMCLPFALSTSDEAFKNAFGSEAKVAELNTSTSNTDMLHFTTVDNMTAGKAYLVKPTKDNTNFVVSTSVSDNAPSSTEAGGLNFIGVYSPKELTSNDLVMTTNKNTGGNTIKGVNDGTILNGFRAYLTPSGNGARATSFTIDEDGTTGIITATGDVIENGKMYNLGGQRVNEPQRGLYIVNGKKYIK